MFIVMTLYMSLFILWITLIAVAMLIYDAIEQESAVVMVTVDWTRHFQSNPVATVFFCFIST